MFQDEVSHPLDGVRPPAEHWVDRPEVYSSNAQPTGTNRPRACLTTTQLDLQRQRSRPHQFTESSVHTHMNNGLDSTSVEIPDDADPLELRRP